MKTEISKRYDFTLKAICAQGFNVTCHANAIVVTIPDTGQSVFEGDIGAAEKWLLGTDHSPPPFCELNCRCKYVPSERPPFRRNACILFAFCIIIMLGAIFVDHNPGTFLLGLPGVLFFILAFFNTAKHFRWGRKISKIIR